MFGESITIGKNILCVGDDDLISVAIGFLLNELYYDKEANKKKICVFDVDERYIRYISMLAEQYGLPIECLKIDLREPLPIGYANSFDCFLQTHRIRQKDCHYSYLEE